MKAIILAAGISSRMYPVTLEKPKCLLELDHGKAIIGHQISMLNKCGIREIVVATGFLKEKIMEAVGNMARFRNFKDYSNYNNLHTLYSMRDELDDDVVILYSDVVFGEKPLRKCINSKEDFCLLVHTKNVLKDTARVKIRNGGIIDFGNHIPMEEADGNFVGIAKFSRKGAKILAEEMTRMVKDNKHDHDYYMTAINRISKHHKIGFESIGDEPWIELDFFEQYEKAKKEIYPLVK